MSNTEPNPADIAVRSRTNSGELWRSPIATLSPWPLILTGGFLLLSSGSLDTVLSGRWRGLDDLLLYVPPLLWWWGSSRRRGYSVRDLMGPGPTLRQLAFMLAATLVGQTLRAGWLAGLVSLDLIPGYWRAAATRASAETALAPAQYFAFIIAGPCVEEILFRGLIFRRCLRRMRPMFAALWSSLLFGLCHFDILGSLLFALILVGLYARSGSLWIPIAAHAVFNAATALVSALVQARASWWAIAVAQLVCVPWLVWFVRSSLRQLRDGEGQQARVVEVLERD